VAKKFSEKNVVDHIIKEASEKSDQKKQK